MDYFPSASIRQILVKKLNNLHLQDSILIIICVLAVYLLRARDTFVLQPIWRLHHGQLNTQLSISYLPKPIVTDLDGDGILELVFVTTSLELQLCTLSNKSIFTNEAVRRLPEPVVKQSVTISTYSLSNTSYPVGLETGYLSPSLNSSYIRSQVILLVLDNWLVLCFDHQLKVLWTQAVANITKPDFFLKSVAIMVLPISLNRGHTGLITVGGARGLRDTGKRMKSQHALFKSRYFKVAENPILDESSDDPNYSHFSTFALSGTDGTILWHHMPGDFVPKNSKENLEAIHWKLAMHQTGKWHVGEVHWKKYEHLIINHLPHSWTHIGDTRMDVSDIGTLFENKRQAGAESAARLEDYDKPALLHDIIDFSDEHLVGLQYGGMRPHSHHEHVKHPSIVVIHHEAGMELLNIQSGRPLTRLNMKGRHSRSLFVDVNGDGTIEEISANFAMKCQAEVSAFDPKPQAYFTGPLCESPFVWGGVGLSNLFSLPDVTNENTHLAITPVVVKSISKHRGILNHLLGRNMVNVRNGYDILFLTSTGRFSSYSFTGRPNWQVMLPTSWSHMALKSEIDINFMETTAGHLFFNFFKPTLTTISLQLFGRQSAALVIGWDSVVLVDLHDGFTLAQHSLPCQAVDQPVIADFNQDGWTDFIILCQDRYIGFTIEKSSNLIYTTMVAIFVVLCIAFLIWFSAQSKHEQ